MKSLLYVSLIVIQFRVAQAGLEPARPFRAKGFSYHYSFRYQAELTFDYAGRSALLDTCLWSGLYLNRIEILQGTV